MVNLDRPGFQFHGLALARQIIGALAMDLDGRILRRGLFEADHGTATADGVLLSLVGHV